MTREHNTGVHFSTENGSPFSQKESTFEFQMTRQRKALTKRCKHIMMCVNILDAEFNILDSGAQKRYQFRPWASFGRVPICDYAALNTSRPGPNAGIAATTTLHILVDL